MKPFEGVALSFATALVARDFARAREMLTPALRTQFSEDALAEEVVNMFRRYGHSDPSHSELVPEGTLETWPDRQPDDLGWAYASIQGDDFVEAIYVLVCDFGGELLIRDIEWGRP